MGCIEIFKILIIYTDCTHNKWVVQSLRQHMQNLPETFYHNHLQAVSNIRSQSPDMQMSINNINLQSYIWHMPGNHQNGEQHKHDQ